MSALRTPVYVLGGASSTFLGKGHPEFKTKSHPDFLTKPNPTLEDHLREAVFGALETTGVDPALIDRGYVSNFLGELFSRQGHMGAMLARVCPALEDKPLSRMEAACASGGISILAAVDALQGAADIALAAGVEIETTTGAREAGDFMARAGHYETERPLDDFTFPYLFARRARAYKEAFGATHEDLGRAVVKAYENARRNPKAHMRAANMTLEYASFVSEKNTYFLTDPAIRPHMLLSDCSQLSDGASCVLLANERGLAKLGISKDRCTEIAGAGHTVRGLGRPTNPVRMETTALAAERAYAAAGIGPEDIQVAEVHDCFSITELQLYEALGFAPPGGAPKLLRDGVTARDGRLPVNTGGGLMGFGHPVGATGIKQVVEIYRQMKGLCGDYQVPRPMTWGVSANIGGEDRTAVVMIQKNLG